MKLPQTISVIVSSVYFAIALQATGINNIVRMSILPIAALVCIWFGDQLGGYTGFTGRGYITQKTPGSFVRFFGWLLLALPPVMWLILR